jgi:iron complex outermembrane receptor protein
MQIVSAPAFAFGAPWFFNAGEARIQGAEVEADARVTSALSVNASVGYLDAEYTKLGSVALAGGLTKDDALVNVPEWSGSVGGTYSIALASSNELSLHADYIYKSEMARDTMNTPLLKTDDFGILNATLSYGPEDGHWRLTAGAENITDERYILSGNNNPGVGAISATYSAPRTWYLGFKVKSE